MSLKYYFPLCYVDEYIVLMYHYGFLCLVDIDKKTVIKKKKFISTFRETVLARSGLVFRAMRLGARTGTYIGDDTALVVAGKTVYEINTQTLDAKERFSNGMSRPMAFGVVDGIEGLKNAVYWGEYRGNPNKEPIRVYRRTSSGMWEVVYTFPDGCITHVHNIVPDRYNKCIWIFTGDFGDGSTIWRTTNDFKTVEPVMRGNQLYRGCIAFPTKEGLIYATDSPFADDFICKLYWDNGNWLVKKLCSISGSCIYGMQLDENTFAFQTTVEPDGRKNGNRWVFFFGRKRGYGIKDDYVHLFVGNPKEGFRDVYQSKKDWLPYILFQFGTFQFPNKSELFAKRRNNGSTLLPFYSMSTRKHNMETQIIEL